MSSYPTINYIGNKEKIVEWISCNLPSDAHSFFDAFAGGCSVSYMAKSKGLDVYSNDILEINYHIAKAIVENNDVVLNSEDVELIFNGDPFEGFMYKHYANKYYLPNECMELDLYRQNIDKLDNEYKKSLALVLLRRAMIRKMPYSRFTIKWDKIKQLRDEDYSYRTYGRRRAYHNKTFRFHFEDNLEEYNNSIFKNTSTCRAINLDVFDAIDVVDADVIYMDPPYAGTMNDYYGFYGLLDSYITGKEILPFNNNFISKDTINEQFDKLFSKLGKYKYWMLSYNSRSKPSKDVLIDLVSKYSGNIQVLEMPYVYKVTGKEKKQKDIEYLFIINNKEYAKK